MCVSENAWRSSCPAPPSSQPPSAAHGNPPTCGRLLPTAFFALIFLWLHSCPKVVPIPFDFPLFHSSPVSLSCSQVALRQEGSTVPEPLQQRQDQWGLAPLTFTLFCLHSRADTPPSRGSCHLLSLLSGVRQSLFHITEGSPESSWTSRVEHPAHPAPTPSLIQNRGDLSNWEIRALSLPGLKPFKDPYDLLLKIPILGLHSRPLVRAASPYIHLLPKLNYLFPEHCAVPCLCTCCSHFMALTAPLAPQCTWYTPYTSEDGSASPAVAGLCRWQWCLPFLIDLVCTPSVFTLDSPLLCI